MKPINEMSLAECIERLRKLPNGTVDDANVAVMFPGVPWIFDVAGELADRIHDLTRWIPVEERLPSKADADQSGYVIFRDVDNEPSGETYHSMVQWDNVGKFPNFYTVKDWKRIDP